MKLGNRKSEEKLWGLSRTEKPTVGFINVNTLSTLYGVVTVRCCPASCVQVSAGRAPCGRLSFIVTMGILEDYWDTSRMS